jgi:hypothetical protein
VKEHRKKAQKKTTFAKLNAIEVGKDGSKENENRCIEERQSQLELIRNK